MRKITETIDKVRQLGVMGVLTHLARRALTYAPGGQAARFFLIVLDTPRPTPTAVEAARGHTFRFATLEDLERLKQDGAAHIYERDIESFRNGCRCLLQCNGEELVGYTWISSAPLIEIMWGFHFNMPDDMVYNYNGYTSPKYRGTAYQGLRHLKVLEYTRAEGKRRLLGYVDHMNYKSLHGVSKSGYQRIGVLRGVQRHGQIHFSVSLDERCWAAAIRSGPIQR